MILLKRPAKMRIDYELIESLVPDNAKVLDLGCGDGQLLSDLIEYKRCEGRGVEIDEAEVMKCIGRGVPVFQGDMLEGMSFYRDGHFDVVILSQTLQQAQVIHRNDGRQVLPATGDNGPLFSVGGAVYDFGKLFPRFRDIEACHRVYLSYNSYENTTSIARSRER